MHSHLARLIGQFIVTERERKNLLQKDLAEKLEISAQFLGRIERGEVMMPPQGLKSCVLILNLSQRKMTQIYKQAGVLDVEDIYKDCARLKKRKRRSA
ncbi:MAG: helix-turn-helix transcriptional regulator [Bdellovibrionales bacterium]|nr:helix-turn-helix domain-containing protein [Bdellovibrionales bacterium]NQZ18160.1 helix-turn-helix transcriptional regulator [Bdellovibrionales bacterium]